MPRDFDRRVAGVAVRATGDREGGFDLTDLAVLDWGSDDALRRSWTLTGLVNPRPCWIVGRFTETDRGA